MDGLMKERCAMGKPGMSIRWPAISGVGMAAAVAGGTGENLLEFSHRFRIGSEKGL
jgi:hypothetical protein